MSPADAPAAPAATATDVPAGLIFVDPPAAPDYFNVLLFGPAGTGKSTAAARLAKYGPVLWLNLEGAGALANPRKVAGRAIMEVRLNPEEVMRPGREGGVDGLATLREFVRYAKTADPAPAAVVVDTVGKLRTALANQLVVPGSRQVRDQWGEVAKILRQTLAILRDLPCHLVLIAHQSIDGEGDERITAPRIGGALTEEVPTEMDVVAYCAQVVITPEEGEPVTQYVGQFVQAHGRQGPKDRSDALGRWRPLDLAEWFETYREGLTASDEPLPWDDDFEPAETSGPGPEDPGRDGGDGLAAPEAIPGPDVSAEATA